MASINLAKLGRPQQGSVILLVLGTLAVSSLVLADTVLDHQQRLQQELERTYLAELHIVAQSVFDQAGLVLEAGLISGQAHPSWPTQWQVPQGITYRAELSPESCPGNYPGHCYRIELTLYGRGGTSLQRQQKYWGEAGCGSAWLMGSN
ncbi:hypothetical protein [Aliidiomarina quisquiliarum]|uniref:hypothetical protein n=1 Tax=Aliidiomarina quisquiliarum TaxID=2938947 RepID=UPI00208FD5F6|nr:hypothetical protein [Aliidiomarina quisquiliarum]MCO4321673.1 hypothetical protein [Aliidiomarina quisquiliarum]